MMRTNSKIQAMRLQYIEDPHDKSEFSPKHTSSPSVHTKIDTKQRNSAILNQILDPHLQQHFVHFARTVPTNANEVAPHMASNDIVAAVCVPHQLP